MQKIKITEILKNKLLVVTIALVVISFVIPLKFVFFSDADGAEAAIYSSEIYRNSALWLFDNFFISLLAVIILILLLDIVTRRRITVIKIQKKAVAAMIIILLLITPLAFNRKIRGQNQPERKTPLANKVFIITFDGTRADVFWEGNHWITQHKEEGAWAEKFSCTYPTVTYPNHISIVTGTWPQIHRCELNPSYAEQRKHIIFRDYREPVSEDIFSIAEKYDIVTALFMAPQSLEDMIGGPKTYRAGLGNARKNMDDALEFINKNKTEIESHGLLAFIHLIDSDEIMHEYSTESDEYRHAIEMQGNLVGKLIENITVLGWANDTIVIVTADHAAIGYGHFNRFPTTVCDVPFWVWGGPIKSGAVIYGGRLIDIGVTVAFALGISRPADAVGVVLYRLFKEDLLKEKRGIDNVADIILDEYKESVNRAYFDCVKYLLGLSVMIIITIFVIMDLVKQRRKLREVVTKLGEGEISGEKG